MATSRARGTPRAGDDDLLPRCRSLDQLRELCLRLGDADDSADHEVMLVGVAEVGQAGREVTGSPKHWTGGVARSFGEMQAIDEAWWLDLTPAERIELTAELSASYDWSDVADDEDGAVRLLGPRGGIRSRGR